MIKEWVERGDRTKCAILGNAAEKEKKGTGERNGPACPKGKP